MTERKCSKCSNHMPINQFYIIKGNYSSWCKSCYKERNKEAQVKIKVDKIEGEVWKDVNGYENLYQVSNTGRVKSTSKLVNHRYGSRNVQEKILAPAFNRKTLGYLVVSLSVNGISKIHLVHRLVATAFIPNPENLPQVNHKDFDKTNNSIQNLEWVSERENNCHKSRTKESSSRYIGVHRRAWDGKFVASIFHNTTSVVIGSFISEEDAYHARIQYENNHNIKNKYIK